jgi:hypothetical protein
MEPIKDSDTISGKGYYDDDEVKVHTTTEDTNGSLKGEVSQEMYNIYYEQDYRQKYLAKEVNGTHSIECAYNFT